MSSWHKLLIRIALSQRKMLIETKTRTLFKMLKMALLNCSINEKCCWVQLELTDALRLVNIHFIAYPKAKGNRI